MKYFANLLNKGAGVSFVKKAVMLPVHVLFNMVWWAGILSASALTVLVSLFLMFALPEELEG